MGASLIESLQKQIKMYESLCEEYKHIIDLKDQIIAIDERHIQILEKQLGMDKTKPGSFTAAGSIEDVSTEVRKENP